MTKIEIRTADDLQKLNVFGEDAVFHGTHVSPANLGFVAVGESRIEQALIPHPATQYASPEARSLTLREGHLAVVGFYDQAQRGGAAFNAGVGLARLRTPAAEQRRGFDYDEPTGAMSYTIQEALLRNVKPWDENFLYAATLDDIIAVNARFDPNRAILPIPPDSPDQPHDKWALGPVAINPHNVAVVYGSFIFDLAERGDLHVNINHPRA